MTTFFEVLILLIGVAIVVLLWGIFVRLADIHNLQGTDAKALCESLQRELHILWYAIVYDREELAEQRKTFGFGPLFSWHESLAEYIPSQRERYQRLQKHLEELRSKYWPPEEQAKKKIEIEEAELDLKMNTASATQEEREKWHEIKDAGLNIKRVKKT